MLDAAYGIVISIDKEEMEMLDWVRDQQAKKNADVVVRHNGVEKCFSLKDFLTTLGFEMGQSEDDHH